MLVHVYSHKHFKECAWADPEGDRGSGPPWNCQIINFCHVEIFRQTPSGNLGPLRKFSGSALGVALVLSASLSFQLTFHNFLNKEKVPLVLYFTNIQNFFFFI